MAAATGKAGPPAATAAQIAEWLRLFVEPGQVTELQALSAEQRYGNPKTVAGFFDAEHLDEMAAAAARLSGKSKGVYFIPNPLNPDPLARRCKGTHYRGFLRRVMFAQRAGPARRPIGEGIAGSRGLVFSGGGSGRRSRANYGGRRVLLAWLIPETPEYSGLTGNQPRRETRPRALAPVSAAQANGYGRA